MKKLIVTDPVRICGSDLIRSDIWNFGWEARMYGIWQWAEMVAIELTLRSIIAAGFCNAHFILCSDNSGVIGAFHAGLSHNAQQNSVLHRIICLLLEHSLCGSPPSGCPPKTILLMAPHGSYSQLLLNSCMLLTFPLRFVLSCQSFSQYVLLCLTSFLVSFGVSMA